MLDLNLALKVNTNDILVSTLGQKNSTSSATAFSKILDSASKSYMANNDFMNTNTTSNYIQETNISDFNNENKIKNYQKEENNENKHENDSEDENENQETGEEYNNVTNINNENIVSDTTFQSETNTTKDNLNDTIEETVETEKPTDKNISETLTKTNENEVEIEDVLEKNIIEEQNGTTTNITKSNTSTQNSTLANQNGKTLEVQVSNEVLMDVENAVNTVDNSSNTLDSALSDMDMGIEVTAVKFDTSYQRQGQHFDFNSSSFNDLSSHVTKLSLNKTANFSKVLNEKMTSETQVLNQAKEASNLLSSKGTSSVSMILRPEGLGKLNVNLFSKNGVLTAQFVAQNQQVADSLNKNLDTLKQNLIDQGVKVNEITVKVQEPSSTEHFSNNLNYSDDKLHDFKGNNSERHFSKTNNNEEEEERKKYLSSENDEQPETEDLADNSKESVTRHIKVKNNNLEIYNNMGRKL